MKAGDLFRRRRHRMSGSEQQVPQQHRAARARGASGCDARPHSRARPARWPGADPSRGARNGLQDLSTAGDHLRCSGDRSAAAGQSGHADPPRAAQAGWPRRQDNFPSMPYQQVPAFAKRLRAAAGNSPRCLEFAILGAARQRRADGPVGRVRREGANLDDSGRQVEVPRAARGVSERSGRRDSRWSGWAERVLRVPRHRGAPRIQPIAVSGGSRAPRLRRSRLPHRFRAI
jgi:hypothetical protein